MADPEYFDDETDWAAVERARREVAGPAKPENAAPTKKAPRKKASKKKASKKKAPRKKASPPPPPPRPKEAAAPSPGNPAPVNRTGMVRDEKTRGRRMSRRRRLMGAKWGGRALKYGLPGLGYLGLLSMLTRGGGGEERVSPEERRTQEYPAMALQGQIGREDGEMMRLMEELERATQMAGHMGGGMRGGGFPVTGASLNLMDFVNHRLPELEMIAAQNRNTPTFSQLMGTSGGGAF